MAAAGGSDRMSTSTSQLNRAGPVRSNSSPTRPPSECQRMELALVGIAPGHHHPLTVNRGAADRSRRPSLSAPAVGGYRVD